MALCKRCKKKLAWHAFRKELCPDCVRDGLSLLTAINAPEKESSEKGAAVDGQDFFDLAGILGALQIQEVHGNAPEIFTHVLLKPRRFPLRALAMSVSFHVVTLSSLVLLQMIMIGDSFQLSQDLLDPDTSVMYCRPSDLLPLMNSPKPGPKDPAGHRHEVKPPKGSTSFHTVQTVQSSPLKPDNPSQTIVQPHKPDVILKKEIKVPNIVIWNVDEAKVEINQLVRKTAMQMPATATPMMKPPDPSTQNVERSLADLRISKNAMRMPGVAAPAIKPPDAELKNVDRSLTDLDVSKLDALNSNQKVTMRRIASPAWALGAEAGKDEEMINVPGAKSAGGVQNLIVLSANPGLPSPGSLKVPPGNRTGAFSISPDGNREGSPDGWDEGAVGGGVLGGGGTGGTGSGAGGGRDIASIQIPGLSVKGGAAGPLGVAAGKPQFTDMVTIEEPADTYNVTIVEGRSGAAGLGVYGVLSGARNYTVFITMPGGRWIMQFSEMPAAAPPAPAVVQARYSQSQVNVGISDVMVQPRPIRKVDPGRPEDGELAKLRGLTVLYGIVRRDGSVDKIRVVRSLNPALDQRAVEALKKWKFKPAMLGNEIVEVQALFGIPFRPQSAR